MSDLPRPDIKEGIDAKVEKPARPAEDAKETPQLGIPEQTILARIAKGGDEDGILKDIAGEEPPVVKPKEEHVADIGGSSTSENTAPKGWGFVDSGGPKLELDFIEDDFALSPEQQAEIQRIDRRTQQVRSTVAHAFPDQDIAQLARSFASSEISDEELNEFARIMIGAGEKITPLVRLNYTSHKLEPAPFSPREVSRIVPVAESLEEARLIDSFATTWKEKFMDTAQDNQKINRSMDFVEAVTTLSGFNRSPRPPALQPGQAQALFDAWIPAYEEVYTLPPTYDKAHEFTSRIQRIGRDNGDIDSIGKLTKLFKEARITLDDETLKAYSSAIVIYGLNHGITEDAAVGLGESLLPVMQKKDSQVAILQKGGNIWGMRQGDFGAADFLVHSYALRVSPSNLNELQMIARDIPSSNLAIFEQNRIDALAMAKPFSALRDFIHDQRSGVHDVLTEMVKYYDTGDNSRLLELASKAEGYLNSPERQALLLDKSNYDGEVTETIGGEKRQVKAIDVLRRLEKNTEPIDEAPPTTNDAELNARMAALSENQAGRSGQRGNLQSAFDYMNTHIVQMAEAGQIGVEPNFIHAISWMERQGFKALQAMKYEDQIGAYKQPWFKSVVRFQELTASPHDFHEEEFQSFVDRLSGSTSEDAYKMVASRVLGNVNELAKKYKAEGREEKTGALWSGNIAHELIGLTDLKPAETVQGQKHRTEALRPEKDRLKGD